MIGLTQRQKECLDAIRRLTVDGVPPSYEELRADLGLSSKSGVVRAVDQLASRGYVARASGRARSLYVLDDEVSPATLAGMGSEHLRRTLTFVVATLAQRDGDAQTAAVLQNIADRLMGRPRKAAA